MLRTNLLKILRALQSCQSVPYTDIDGDTIYQKKFDSALVSESIKLVWAELEDKEEPWACVDCGSTEKNTHQLGLECPFTRRKT